MDRQAVREAFGARMGRSCEVVARAPGRVNLIGEHTDYNEGLVLPVALEQSTWAACAARDDDVVRVASSDVADEASWPVGKWDRERYSHWTSYVAGVSTLLRRRGARLRGFDLLIQSRVPVGGGLSSSAALEVSAALGLAVLAGEVVAPLELVNLARAAEHEFAGVPCGIMDQYVSVLGRAGTAFLLDCRDRTYEHVPVRLEGYTFMVVDSGARHELAAGEYARRQQECAQAVAYFQRIDAAVRSLRDVDVETVREHAPRMEPLAAARSRHVASENERTQAAAEALRGDDAARLGELFLDSHRSLRDDYEVSCDELDELVELLTGIAGVAGARMTGGGFGGCVVAVAHQDSVARVEDELCRKFGGAQRGCSRVIRVRPGPGASVEFP